MQISKYPFHARGRRGEEAAAEFLVRSGYRILVRNWRCPLGEIDLIAAKDDEAAICEVKTLKYHPAGAFHPSDRVGPLKQRKLRQLAGAFWELHGRTLEKFGVRSYRFDILSVYERDGRMTVERFTDSF